jgi:hypothetical protein
LVQIQPPLPNTEKADLVNSKSAFLRLGVVE